MLKMYLAIQGIVTLVLLGFAYLLHDTATTNLVIGAVITHWLKEAQTFGREAVQERKSNGTAELIIKAKAEPPTGEV